MNSISLVLLLKYIFPVLFFYLGKILRQYFSFYLSKIFRQYFYLSKNFSQYFDFHLSKNLAITFYFYLSKHFEYFAEHCSQIHDGSVIFFSTYNKVLTNFIKEKQRYK